MKMHIFQGILGTGPKKRYYPYGCSNLDVQSVC